MELFTIGHSNHDIDKFISLLQQHQIDVVADVRSHPYSKFLPHFKKAALEKALTQAGISYLFLGKELGARPNHEECYVDGKAVYEKIAQTEEFRSGIARLLRDVNQNQPRISLMCAEQDPLTCHRAILVCQHLRKSQPDIDINHILKDGYLENHNHLEDRMLKKHGLTEFQGSSQPIQLSLFAPSQDSFPTKAECLEQAYRLQGDEIAYVEKDPNSHDRDH